MEQPRSASMAICGIARVKIGRVQRFTWLERILEIEVVIAADHAHLAIGRLLDCDPPVAAPCERAEPDGAVFFIRVAAIDGEPWIEVVAGMALAALQNFLAFMDRLTVDLRFSGPTPAEVSEGI